GVRERVELLRDEDEHVARRVGRLGEDELPRPDREPVVRGLVGRVDPLADDVDRGHRLRGAADREEGQREEREEALHGAPPSTSTGSTAASTEAAASAASPAAASAS